MFPDDWPAEDQHEVRTVEEESLFRAAYPEVVESYLRDKALAEENKSKSKTSCNYVNIQDLIQHDVFCEMNLVAPHSPPTLKHKDKESMTNIKTSHAVLTRAVGSKAP